MSSVLPAATARVLTVKPLTGSVLVIALNLIGSKFFPRLPLALFSVFLATIATEALDHWDAGDMKAGKDIMKALSSAAMATAMAMVKGTYPTVPMTQRSVR